MGEDEGAELGEEEGADEGAELGEEEGAELGEEEGADEGAVLGEEEGADEGAELGEEEGAEVVATAPCEAACCYSEAWKFHRTCGVQREELSKCGQGDDGRGRRGRSLQCIMRLLRVSTAFKFGRNRTWGREV